MTSDLDDTVRDEDDRLESGAWTETLTGPRSLEMRSVSSVWTEDSEFVLSVSSKSGLSSLLEILNRLVRDLERGTIGTALVCGLNTCLTS